jgi:hypothetical protein
MTHWHPSSYVGIATSPGVERTSKNITKDCKGCGRFDPKTVEGAKTQLRCIKNGCEINNLGGRRPNRKTKMQKKNNKKRRTKRANR